MILNFEEDIDIAAVGDIHGEYDKFIFQVNNRYKIENTIFICCGDFGAGFYKPNYYIKKFEELNKKLQKHNNILITLRGNHDDPSYYNGNYIYSNIKLIPDYTIINTPTKTLLLVGGAYSIDRSERLKDDIISGKKSYFTDEVFIYSEEKLYNINNEFANQITHVFTHSSPNFCNPLLKDGIIYWLNKDPQLHIDCNEERENHTKLFNYLIEHKHPIREWYYGHFHFSKTEMINNVKFNLLTIDEIKYIN